VSSALCSTFLPESTACLSNHRLSAMFPGSKVAHVLAALASTLDASDITYGSRVVDVMADRVDFSDWHSADLCTDTEWC